MAKQLKRDTHGLKACYMAGCRCDLCRAAYKQLYWEARGFATPPPPRVAKPKRVKLTPEERAAKKEASRLRQNKRSKELSAAKRAATSLEERQAAWLLRKDAANARRKKARAERRVELDRVKAAKRLATADLRKAKRRETSHRRYCEMRATDPEGVAKALERAAACTARRKLEDPEGYKRAKHESYMRRRDAHLAYSKAHPRKRHNLPTTPKTRLESNLRNRLKELVAPLSHKSTKIHSLIGCTRTQLHSHLEVQFLPGQTWANYGTAWHVDHIMPAASYNLEVPEQQRACFHYTNLQPLWDEINMAKSDSITFDTSYAIAMTPYPS